MSKNVPLLTLTAIQSKMDTNVIGFKTIRIWQFNYDGKGEAIVSYDNAAELDSLGGVDLDLVLFGDPGSGERWYRPKLS